MASKSKQPWCSCPSEYINLLTKNPKYRLYLLSHICQHIGDWYIRIATLLALNRLSSDSAQAISTFVVVQTVTQLIFSQAGGVLADSMDKRKLMMALDLFGAVVTLGFLVALREGSLIEFYIFGACRAFVQAFYDPVTRSIVPMLVSDVHDLKRATTLNGLAWAFFMAIGGIVAGKTEEYFGLQGCFVLDSITYAFSALILFFMKGDFKVPNENLERTEKEAKSKIKEKRSMVAKIVSIALYPITKCCGMVFDVAVYLWNCGFGAIVLLKASGALCWGAADVLNVQYATIPNDEDASAARLGLIFSCLGLGCFTGPIVATFLISAERPSTTQLVCIGSFAFLVSSWVGMSQSSSENQFSFICIFTTWRALGDSIIWVNSTLLLQQLVSAEFLGRVISVDYLLTELTDAISVWVVAKLLDDGLGKNAITLGLAVLSATVFSLWSIYHLFGLGAARRQQARLQKLKSTTMVIERGGAE
eukprot:CAMPEP_0194246582 /NCGR_PEP_ID=MMETSP0158-20130606/15211_1 /TAXON_ID=33649 /ORGANISM="Thalassionema nitzschioides, Strain L26-B" /LENGTH=475 /DNA_ID=CAMNT_0038982517 /DNA_START=24 /DNA_END=1448 /DNA_ORIENTATION=+